MGTFKSHDGTMDGDVYIQRLSNYIKRNEESLANGLLLFSRNQNNSKAKPSRLNMSLHHLYYILERIENSGLGVEVGPLNIRLDNPNQEPTFISFMANNARNSKHFDSDAKSITSMNSMKSIVSNASMYWRNFSNLSKDPKVITKDIKYLYSSFTKIPCLVLSPKTKVGAINGYEEYPCDTSVPLKMFKNLQVLEMVDYDPNEIYGWHILSDQLRVLIIRNSKLNNLADFLFNLVIEDETNRNSFNSIRPSRRNNTGNGHGHSHSHSHSNIINGNGDLDEHDHQNSAFKYPRRERSHTSSHAVSFNSNSGMPQTHSGSSSLLKDHHFDHRFSNTFTDIKDYDNLADSKWALLKQLTVSDTSLISIDSYVFSPLSNLVKLNLANNLLDAIPEGLDQLVNIKYLNFADNYITNLNNLPRNLPNLTTLNFNNNKIDNIDGLQHLTALEKIDLRRNDLASMSALKPIILLFLKLDGTFNNVYLANNKLPKTFRVDLFNLINGAKYKNKFKIDDSRPGYFEGALLLDKEGVIQNLKAYCKNEMMNSYDDSLVELLEKFKLNDSTSSPLSNNQNVSNKPSHMKHSTTLNNISGNKNTPTSTVSTVQATARMST